MTDTTRPRPTLTSFAFVLAVPDLVRSSAYYRDVLGFSMGWEEADDWRLMERDGVRVMLGRCPDAMAARDTGDHSWFGYLHVDDVDALHAEITARGALCTAPEDRSYGQREMLVTTIDGHRIVISQILRSRT